jgi:hypothetical protein
MAKRLRIAGAPRFREGDNDQGRRKHEADGGPAAPVQAFALGNLLAEKSRQQADTDEAPNRNSTRFVHVSLEV